VDPTRRAVRVVRGRLELVFAVRGGRTALVHSHVAAPLKIVRPFALDDGRALVQVLTLGPGMVGGDTCAIDVTVEPGARAIVIAQSATRILAMHEGVHASQRVTLRAGPGAQLEYFPGLTIPFPDSSFVQDVSIQADPAARVGIIETWAMGRRMCGEYLRFTRLRSETRVSVGGCPVYADVVDLEPGAVNVGGAGILDGFSYLACGFWYGATLPSAVSAPPDEVMLAVGQVDADQVYVRGLANDGCRLAEALQAVIGRVHAGWRQEPIPVRRFTA